ncbi:MAG: GAP family protein [Mycobacteriaceae bacterium]|nr:GAP family protein [Mycobacteriaceae bacterium]
MWGTVLVLGLFVGLNPMRFGLTLLVISRPRPVHNLIAYGAGSLAACVFAVTIWLTFLHVIPMFKSFMSGLSTTPTFRHIQIGLGVLALSIAAVMTARSLALRRPRAQLPTSGDAPTLVLDSFLPPGVSRLLGRAQDGPAEGESRIRRLSRRLHDAWENGSLWVAFGIGFLLAGIEPDVLLLLTIFLASGVTIGEQIIAAIMFVVGILIVVEITLVSYVVTPTKTRAIVERLHDWALAHRRKIIITMCAVGGVALVARGMGAI